MATHDEAAGAITDPRPSTEPPSERPSRGARVRVVNLNAVAFAVLAAVIAVLLLPSLLTVLISLTIAAVLAIALNPLVARLARVMPRGPAAGLVLLTLVALVVGMGALTIPSIVAQVADLVIRLPDDAARLRALFLGLLDDYPQLTTVINGDLGSTLSSELPQILRTAVGGLVSVSWTTATLGLNALVTAMMVIFLSVNPRPLLSGLLRLMPEPRRDATAEVAVETFGEIAVWGRTTALVMVIMGVTMGGGLFVLGVRDWLVFGVLAAFGELIPMIGPILALIPPVLITLAEDPSRTIPVLIFAFVVQQLESYVLVPLLMGSAAKLHPLAVIAGVMIGGSLAGVAGAFLTVPVLITMKAVGLRILRDRRAPVPQSWPQAILDGRSSP